MGYPADRAKAIQSRIGGEWFDVATMSPAYQAVDDNRRVALLQRSSAAEFNPDTCLLPGESRGFVGDEIQVAWMVGELTLDGQNLLHDLTQRLNDDRLLGAARRRPALLQETQSFIDEFTANIWHLSEPSHRNAEFSITMLATP